MSGSTRRRSIAAVLRGLGADFRKSFRRSWSSPSVPELHDYPSRRR
jgi:hypothetical protein